jgi:phospholipase/carboxylesterase
MTRHESTSSEEAVVGLRFLYRPAASPQAPLVVLVHGRAGNRSVMWTFERSIPETCHVVSFEAFLQDPIGGWSWWDMTAPGSRHGAIVYAAQKLRGSLEAFKALYALDPSSLVGLGFSQGSVLLSAVTLRGLTAFDAVAILAGMVYQPSESLNLAKKPEFFVAHGSHDETIPVAQARAGVEALKKLGIQVEYVEEEVGHKVGIQGTRALKQWVLRHVE